MAVLTINGDIIPNEYDEVYSFFGLDGTSPNGIRKAIAEKPEGEKLVVQINSPGGRVDAGQEIYSLLKERNDVEIQVIGMACSAASLIAMAGPCFMSEPAMIMIHNAASMAAGDYHEMEKEAEALKAVNEAIANAYVSKTGKPLEDILQLMDDETWIPTKKAVELGFADGIIPRETQATNYFGSSLAVTRDQIEAFRKEREDKSKNEKRKKAILDDLYRYGA